jgi:hypothetical protein
MHVFSPAPRKRRAGGGTVALLLAYLAFRYSNQNVCVECMASFEDLSSYTYIDSGIRSGTVNVGWLDFRTPFPKGAVTSAVLERLWLHCKNRVVQTRGLHTCYFCDYPQCQNNQFEYCGEKLLLGSAEIRVFDNVGNIFASPDLVFHYIRDHSYLPPNSFLRALLEGPTPGTTDYILKMKSLALD